MTMKLGRGWEERIAKLTSTLTFLLTAACGGSYRPAAGTLQAPVELTPFDEYVDPGIVVLALTADVEEIFEIQMNIAAAANASGPVVLLANAPEDGSRVYEHCGKYLRLCEMLEAGRVRVVEAPFHGPWIRDYGPQFGFESDRSVVVLDAQYHDVRADHDVDEARAMVDQLREQLIEEHLPGVIEGQEIDHQTGDILRLLQQLSEIYANPGAHARLRDDRAPVHIAEAVLGSPRFRLVRPPINLDGGNFMRLPDGRCATTGALIGRNAEGKHAVDEVLRDFYGCKDTIFLRALPGHNVIEHVDMFLLPAGERLLVSSYDPRTKVLQGSARKLERRESAVVLDAALAMEENARHLEALGYAVTRVPSPLPVLTDDGVFYPTVLNALVRVDFEHRRRHVLIPKYGGIQEEIQEDALRVIRHAFGDAPVTPIEALDAAKRQGAIHCLALVAPHGASFFGDEQKNRQRRAMQASMEAIRGPSAIASPSGLSSSPHPWIGTWEPRHDAHSAKGRPAFDIGLAEVTLWLGRKPVQRWTVKRWAEPAPHTVNIEAAGKDGHAIVIAIKLRKDDPESASLELKAGGRWSKPVELQRAQPRRTSAGSVNEASDGE